MTSVQALVELGEHYAALGLPAAARGAFVRALAAAQPDDAVPARRLAELALASGDGAGACRHAREVVARDPGPSARVLLGRAQLVAGELDAARFSFAAALASPRSSPLVRARAHLGHAAVAAAGGDSAGAGANAMAGLDELLRFMTAAGRGSDEVDAELPLAEELLARAVDANRAADAEARIDELTQAPGDLLRALLLGARQARGDSGASDADIEQALVRELERRPASQATRLRLIERRLRRRYQDAAARAEAVAELERMAADAQASTPASTPASTIELARVCFLLAAAYEDDPGHADQAEALYRQGLTLRPGHAAAAGRLALLALARGDGQVARAEVERALRIDPSPGPAWRNAVRVLDALGPGPDLAGAVGRLLDAADPGAGAAAVMAPRLMGATAEVARDQVLAGMYARGHRVKNVLGIIGSRTRSARKLAEGDLARRLADLEREVTSLYDEWAAYLRSMQTAGPVIEVVPAGVLLAEVVEAAAARTAMPLHLAVAGGLPDLRGDRMLLREALLNIISNAAEACEPTGGRVDITARVVASGTPSPGGADGEHRPEPAVDYHPGPAAEPVVEIVVADTGPGIPRRDLGRVLAPGFTTKESGSGIGLAIAERVVSAHHGRILIESEEGQGTRVTVVLPSDLGGSATLGTFSRFEPEGR